MKRRNITDTLILLALLLAAAPVVGSAEEGAKPSRLSLRLTGGLSWGSGGGDLENLRTDTRAVFLSLPKDSKFTSAFDWECLSASRELGFELVLNVAPHVGLGVGTGTMFGARSRGTYGYDFSIAQFLQGSGYSQDDHAAYAQDFELGAFPVRAGLYVSQEFGPLSIYGFGGVELVFASIDHSFTVAASLQDKGLSTYAPQTEHDVDLTLTARETAKTNALGYRAGFGAEIRIAGPASLGLEIYGRILRLKNWAGDGTIESLTRVRDWMDGLGWYSDATTPESFASSGKWLYRFDYDPALRYLYTLENILVESPKKAASTYFRARDAVIDLGGVGVTASLRIRL